MIRRYVRAFIIALKMTLRGETPPPAISAPMQDWITQAINRLDQIDTLAARHQIDPTAVVMHIDMRDISMAMVLRTVRYHMTSEYPILLRHRTVQSFTILQATNFDDHYRVTRLEAAAELADNPVRHAVSALAAHLESLSQPEI